MLFCLQNNKSCQMNGMVFRKENGYEKFEKKYVGCNECNDVRKCGNSSTS